MLGSEKQMFALFDLVILSQEGCNCSKFDD